MMPLPPFPSRLPPLFITLAAILFPAAARSALDEAIVSGPIRFIHPMTVTNPSELEIIRDRIARKVEPQHAAYLQLIAGADKALDFTPDPPATVFIMGGYEPDSNSREMGELLRSSASAAYSCALAWTFTGKDGYARKALEVLNAWVEADTEFGGKNAALQLGSDFTAMLYAADLLHHYEGWPPIERARFERFWRQRCLVHTRFAMMRENNWGDYGLMGALAAAIVFEDEPLARRCLSRLDDYFYGNWKIRRDQRGTFLPREVERNEGRSGLNYTAYALAAVTQALEMARNFGPAFDWWSRPTEGDATLKDAVEWYFRWNMLEEPFPWYELETGEPERRMAGLHIFEAANTRLDLDPRVTAWIEARRPGIYATLLKGDMDISR